MDITARLLRAEKATTATAAKPEQRPTPVAGDGPTAAQSFVARTRDAVPVKQSQSAARPAREADEGYHELKTKLHDRLLDLLDLSLLETTPEAEVRAEISRQTDRILREEHAQAPLSIPERRALISQIQDEVLGLGPLEPFLKDDTVNDILVNTYRNIYVERSGKLELTGARFKDESHLKKIIDRIVSRIGRRIDESSPMVDARLMDGSRVNAIIPPLAVDGASMSIRKFSRDPLELDDLINFGALIPQMGEVLKGIVRARLNILISGGTGSGKTTLLNVLSRFIPADERIVTIEDAAELQLKQTHVVRLETRPQNIEGRGEVTQRDLVKNCLRMRPDRIIIGECRGAEALDMLQAMNTGHDGSLTTIHANTPRDALMRLETMVSMAGMNLAPVAMRRFISSAVDVIIQGARLADGSRKVISFQEITGMEGEMITMQEIVRFEQTGIGEKGKVQGHFRVMGVRPNFAARLESMGVRLAENAFAPQIFPIQGG